MPAGRPANGTTPAWLERQTFAAAALGSDGIPVMAIGGFSGSDPAPSLAEFQALVARHEVHYFVSGGGFAGLGAAMPSGASAPSGAPGGAEPDLPGGFAGLGGAGGGSGDGSQITSWVQAHFPGQSVGSTTVYDLSSPKVGGGRGGSPAN